MLYKPKSPTVDETHPTFGFVGTHPFHSGQVPFDTNRRPVNITCGKYKSMFNVRGEPRPAARAAVAEVLAKYETYHAETIRDVASDALDTANSWVQDADEYLKNTRATRRRTTRWRGPALAAWERATDIRRTAKEARAKSDRAISLAVRRGNEARNEKSAFTAVESPCDAEVFAIALDFDHVVAKAEQDHAANLLTHFTYQAGQGNVDDTTVVLMGELSHLAATHAEMAARARDLSLMAASAVATAAQNPNEALDAMACDALEVAEESRRMVRDLFEIKDAKYFDAATHLHETTNAANQYPPALVAHLLFCAKAPVDARHIKVRVDGNFSTMWVPPQQFSWKTGVKD